MKKHIKHECAIDGMVWTLPVFKGYTVDVRLRQFRKANLDSGLEFVDFESPQGDDLLEEYLGTLDENSAEFKEIAAYLLTRG